MKPCAPVVAALALVTATTFGADQITGTYTVLSIEAAKP
jgi:hypothetical protein